MKRKNALPDNCVTTVAIIAVAIAHVTIPMEM